jgi:hypothetical protein
MRHNAKRRWWRPWCRGCTCGCNWFPCPDSVTTNAPPVAASLRLWTNNPHWNDPAARLPNVGPLMTRGQQWRTRQSGR